MTTPTEALTNTEHRLVITRTLNAPRDRVWQAWTQSDHLMRWFRCKDLTLLSAEADVRPGGAWRSAMRSPDGREFIHGGVYREVERPHRLVFTHTWEKNDCEPPANTLVTLTLTAQGNRTVMTFEQVGFATAESGQSHHGGWSDMFDKLAALLDA